MSTKVKVGVEEETLSECIRGERYTVSVREVDALDLILHNVLGINGQLEGLRFGLRDRLLEPTDTIIGCGKNK